jgi:tetratricopeptide (TPR) repeat protein
MDCETVERENIAERYLAGTLEPQLKEQWERHYFGCDRCAELLDTWQAIAEPLHQRESAIRQEIRPRKTRAQWLWAGAAIAAALVIGLAVKPSRSLPGENPPKAQVAAPAARNWTELARLDPPAYQPSTLRAAGSKAEVQFQTAMNAYLRRDYRQAIAGLRASLEIDRDGAAPRFFLGACDFLTGDTAGAIREWERVASGDSPFAQEAQFDLAKGYLLVGDENRALSTLRKLAAVPGDFREPARELIERITAVP